MFQKNTKQTKENKQKNPHKCFSRCRTEAQRRSLHTKSLKLLSRLYDTEKVTSSACSSASLVVKQRPRTGESARSLCHKRFPLILELPSLSLEKRSSPYLCIYIGTKLQKTLYRLFQAPGCCQMQGGLAISGLFLSFSISTGSSGTVHIAATEEKGKMKGRLQGQSFHLAWRRADKYTAADLSDSTKKLHH